MQSVSLPRWLARLFACLFYGQLAVFVVLLLVGGTLLLFGPFSNESGTFVLPIEIVGKISATAPTPLASKPVQDWLATPSAYELNARMPTYLSRTAANTDRYFLNFSIRGAGDLRDLPGLLLIVGSGWLLGVGLVLFITYTLLQLFRNLAQRQVFDNRQSRRVTRIGQAFVTYAGLYILVKWLAQWGGISYLEANGFVFSGAKLNLGFPAGTFTALLMGLCILALAQVFKYGVQLKQESELTI